ncbi:MAG: corrinoid protein [Anaerolineales bacterium]|nr:corrinoid protein [Anaerolineales bacterium]
MHPLIQIVYQNVLDGAQDLTAAAVEAALGAGLEPGAILNDGMIPAMREVGRLFEQGDCFVPEMLISARAMQTGLEVLRPRLVQADLHAQGKIVLGTTKGDLHDIGKNLVGMMLAGAAFEVIDLGINVSPGQFVEAVREHRPQLLGISALLTTTMPHMKATLQALQAAGLRDQVKVMVGGAPLTEDFAREIGADGYSPDASRAVTLAKALVE